MFRLIKHKLHYRAVQVFRWFIAVLDVDIYVRYSSAIGFRSCYFNCYK